MTPAFPQFSGPPNSLAHHALEPRSSFASFNSIREDQGWPLPPRSLSFGQVEDLSHGYSHPYNSPLPLDVRRRASEMQPPSLQTSSNNSKNTSISEVSTPPLSTTVTSQSMSQFVAPAWHALPDYSMMTKVPEYSTWSSEPAPLAKVQEEDIGASFHGDTTAVYSSAA